MKSSAPIAARLSRLMKLVTQTFLNRVRDADFEKQLHERLELAERDKQNAVELAQAKVTSELQKAASAKDAEIQALKARLDAGERWRKSLLSVRR